MGRVMNAPRRLVVIAVMSFIVTFATSAAAATSTIGILVFNGFLTSDVTAPVEVFGAATKKAWFSSYEVIVISATKAKEAVSEEGLKIVADRTIYDDLKLDALIVPSSYTMNDVLKNKDLISFIKKQSRSASWIASNCSGAYLLGEAGVLDGKNATTWAGGEKKFADSYPKIKVQFDRNVVVDHNVITSNGGPVSYQAAFELLAKLSSEKFANEISEKIQFARLRNAFK
jgi:transcriptional regulator GlxA family with amidase domain